MVTATIDVPHFQMGRVTNRTFNVIGHNLATFAILSLLVAIPMLIMQFGLSRFSSGVVANGELNFSALGVVAIAVIVWLLSTFLLQAGLIHGTVTYLNGKNARVADCLSTALTALVPLFLLTILMLLGIFVGALLLIVPAIMLAVMWSVAVPACVTERTGVVGALKRSRELTRGHRWAVFGLFIAFGILNVAIALAFSVASGTPLAATSSVEAAAALTPLQAVASVLGSTINAVIGATLVASIYYELRVLKDGIGPQALAAVFD